MRFVGINNLVKVTLLSKLIFFKDPIPHIIKFGVPILKQKI